MFYIRRNHFFFFTKITEKATPQFVADHGDNLEIILTVHDNFLQLYI